MLRRVKTSYGPAPGEISESGLKKNKLRVPKAMKSGCLGKRRRQRLLLGENYDWNKGKEDLKIVTSIKYDSMMHKRQKTTEEDVLASTSTAFTFTEKAKRKEYQGNRIYKKQKGGKASIDIFKKPLKMQKTGKWKYFNLFNEKDLKWSINISQNLIDNEVDDDCETDEETMENGVHYNLKQLENLTAFLKKNKTQSKN